MKPNPFFGLVATIMPRPEPDFDFDLALARCRRADAIEIRFDEMYRRSEDFFGTLADRIAGPAFAGKKAILTLRSQEQGGSEHISLYEQWAFWRHLPAALKPLIADELSPVFVDWGLDLVLRAQGKAASALPFPWTKVGCSWHDFDKTPEDLARRLRILEGTSARAFLKLVTTVVAPEDAERIKALFADRTDQRPLSAFGMGPLGESTRRKCLGWGSAATYGYPRGFAKAAPGQLSVDELAEDPAVKAIQQSMNQ